MDKDRTKTGDSVTLAIFSYIMQDRPDSHCNKKGKATEVTAKQTQKQQHIHSPRRDCSLLAPACLGSPP